MMQRMGEILEIRRSDQGRAERCSLKSPLRWLRGLSRRLEAATLLFGLLAICSIAAADPPESSRGKIVALAFDEATTTLFKAYPNALYQSADAGRNWARVILPAAAIGKIAAVATAAHGNGSFYVAGPGMGVLRSEDRGRSWVAENRGLPSREIAALTAHADKPDTIYAYVARRGIFRSEDAGGHWRLMDAGPRDRILQFIHSNMPGSMQTGWFFAATAKGVDRSMDCFCGWRDAGGLARVVNAVAYDPRQPKQVYAATAEGIFVSKDGGEQWSRVNAPGRHVTALVVASSGEVYAAADQGVLFRSDDHGDTWQRVNA
jgi:photosystem II stability/assembly factor-like uncharacterized protein